MKRNFTVGFIFGLFVLGVSGIANANLIGQTVTADWIYPSAPTVLESHTVLVSGAVELPSSTIIKDSKFDIDISANSILFTFNTASAWQSTTDNGWLFSDTFGVIPSFTNYSIGATSAGISNLLASDLSFSADWVYANFSGVAVAGDRDFIRLDIEFAPVPEPATMLLLGTGLVGVAGAARRKKKNQA